MIHAEARQLISRIIPTSPYYNNSFSIVLYIFVHSSLWSRFAVVKQLKDIGSLVYDHIDWSHDDVQLQLHVASVFFSGLIQQWTMMPHALCIYRTVERLISNKSIDSYAKCNA